MRRATRMALVAAAVLLVAAAATGTATAQSCDFPYETVDETGETVVLEERPERVVTLTPSTTQIFVELGEIDRVVGTETNSIQQYPEASNVPDVTEDPDDPTQVFGDGTAENIIEKNPDLVIGAAQIATNPIIGELRDANITVYVAGSAKDLSDIYDKVEEQGRILGSCGSADDVVNWMKVQVGTVRNAASYSDQVDVYYHGGNWPTGYTTASEATFIGNMVDVAGGRMIVRSRDYQTNWPYGLNDEDIINEFSGDNPDWIIRPDSPMTQYDVPSDAYWQNTTAVSEDQVLDLHQNYLQQSAPRVVIPLETMARAFHPEWFELSREDEDTSPGGGVTEDYVEWGDGTYEIPLESGATGSVVYPPGKVQEIAFDEVGDGNVLLSMSDDVETPGETGYGFEISPPEGLFRGSVTVEPSDSAPVEDQRIAKEEDGDWRLLETKVVEDENELLYANTSFSQFAVVAATRPEAEISVIDRSSTSLALSASNSSDEYGEVTSYTWSVGDEEQTTEEVVVDVEGRETLNVSLEVVNDAGLSSVANESFEFERAEASEEDGETVENETSADEEETSGDDGSEGDAPLPGFGAVAALAALLVLSVTRRHDLL